VQLTGAEALIKSLEQQGVETSSGCPVARSSRSTIAARFEHRHILVRHEQVPVTWPRLRPATGRPGSPSLRADRAPRTSSRRSVTHTWIRRDRGDHVRWRRFDRHRRVQECDITGITMVSPSTISSLSRPRTAARVAAAFTWRRPAADRCLSTCPRRKPVEDGLVYPTTVEEFDLPATDRSGARRGCGTSSSATHQSVRATGLYVGGGTLKSGPRPSCWRSRNAPVFRSSRP